MSDSLKKVKPGDPLAIPAATFNAFVDAAQDHRNRQHRQERPIPPGGDASGTIRVKNASGADRDRFAVLGIDVPVFTPTDNLEGFKNEPVLAGIMPTTVAHMGRFVVLAEPLTAGAIGRAVLTGLTPVKVYMDDVLHRSADVDNSNATRLRSRADGGTATILWVEAGTGERWALVHLGLGAAVTGTPYIMLPVATETEAAQTDVWSVTAQPAGKLGVKFRASRLAYNDAGDQKLYAYYRDVTTDSTGRVIAISAETRVEVDAPEAC